MSVMKDRITVGIITALCAVTVVATALISIRSTLSPVPVDSNLSSVSEVVKEESSQPTESVSQMPTSSVSSTASSRPLANKPAAVDLKTANGRTLVWSDEFDGSLLDMNKWYFNRTMNGKDRLYRNDKDHVWVSDGLLHMKATWQDDPNYPYVLPEGLTTIKTMNYRYGYLEMRARVPFKHGAWPSFWFQTATPFAKADYMAEIDAFEVFSSKNKLTATLHKWGQGDHTSQKKDWEYCFENASNLNQEFHIYGFEWNEQEMAFYVDGKQYGRYDIIEAADFDTTKLPGMQGFHDPAYVIFNNELFTPKGGWIVEGWNAEQSDFPIDYEIDWVRLYQNPAIERLYLTEEIKAAEKN